ncbi:type II toxin-antitoxin system RelE/ParE family toxin [Niveispirillum sp.]|uniref:type II toxin-antitoxin system RelE/ParE family toxin n=1 Tax=Niveispirillum sp. TaxID=1917217 RepID=UPI001B6FBB88|nr:type II toxin-antitoxin system RelE/ParE family toxin [Niveispirillum sp.]MBP7339447.1 type II toxin-antitoxin system RelE/ParE family toxin [Niveispirillum sp.]
MSVDGLKPLVWIASSLRDLREFPDAVKRDMGSALLSAQKGSFAHGVKPLKGFGGAGVLEIVEDHDGDTFRAVYTVRFATAIYVLHAFQKKSKRGMETPKHDVDLIRSRMALAEERHKQSMRAP